jgi:hypothetical protein
MLFVLFWGADPIGTMVRRRPALRKTPAEPGTDRAPTTGVERV